MEIEMNQNKHQFASCLFKVPIFSHLSEEEQEGVIDLIRVKKIKKDEVVYHAGEHNPFLYVVHQGKIKISIYDENGKEQVVRVLMPGNFAGEHALFDKKLSSDLAIAIEDSVLCVLNGEELKKYIIQHPTVSFQMLHELSKRLSDAENKIEQISLQSVEKRVANSLLELSKGKKQFVLPFSKTNWASMLGMNQETLSRKLRDLKQNNVIKLTGQRNIEVLKPDYLKEVE